MRLGYFSITKKQNECVNMKIKGQNYDDLLSDIKEIIHYEFVHTK
jgi:hypothetical protein